MKKIYITLIALSVAAISCTKSELVQTPDLGGQEIRFDTYLGKAPMTKATSADLTALQTSGNGFDVKAFIHSGTAKPQTFATADVYMYKAVYWAGATSAAFSYADTENAKYIFSSAAEKPTAPEAVYDGTAIPSNWTDNPENNSLWMAYATKSESGWSAWTVEEYKNQTHANGIWEYDGVTYWPDPNSQKYLSFAAWGVNEITTTGTGETATHTSSNDAINFGDSEHKFTFTVKPTVADQQDLLVAPFQYGKAINTAGTNTAVNIQFKHVLSRVGFKLIANQEDKSVEIKVKNVNLKGSFASEGVVDITADVPSISATDYVPNEYKLLPADTDFFATYSQAEEVDIYNNKATVTLGTSANVAPADGTDPENRYMMIIPTLSSTQATDYVITVEYQLTDAGEETATVTLPDTFRFAAGKSYEFVLKVSTSKVGFYVEVSDWEEGTVDASYPLTPENN